MMDKNPEWNYSVDTVKRTANTSFLTYLYPSVYYPPLDPRLLFKRICRVFSIVDHALRLHLHLFVKRQ